MLSTKTFLKYTKIIIIWPPLSHPLSRISKMERKKCLVCRNESTVGISVRTKDAPSYLLEVLVTNANIAFNLE